MVGFEIKSFIRENRGEVFENGSAGCIFRVHTVNRFDFQQSKMSFAFTRRADLPDYQVVHRRTGYQVGTAEVQLYVKNVLDERGQLSVYTGLTPLGGPANVSILQPRTYGLSINLDF